MSKTKGILISLLLVTMIAATTQSALAGRGSETATGNYLRLLTNPNATGTEVSGWISIFYTQTGKCCDVTPPQNPLDCMNPKVKMFYNMRLQKGNTDQQEENLIYPFSGEMAKSVCFMNYDAQVAEIKRFISSTVIPIIFQEAMDSNREWYIKSIRKVLQPEFGAGYSFGDINCCGPSTNVNEVFEFLMMRVILAVP